MFDKMTVLNTRDKYLEFIAEWPVSFKYKGKTFKELFTMNGDMSLWWLSFMQMKDPEGSPVFYELCRLAQNSAPSVRRKCPSKTIFWLIVLRMAFLVKTLIKLLIVRIFIPRKSVRPGNKRVLFFSLFPDTLKYTNGRLVNRNYLSLPEDLRDTAGADPVYAVYFRSSVLQMIKGLRVLRNTDAVFCEQYLSVMDVLGAFDIVTLSRYLMLRTKKEFKESFKFQGRDVRDLYEVELNSSFAGKGVFESVLLARSFEKMARQLNPACVVTFLEMYPYSRGIYYGVKRADPKIKTVAYQHANITTLKLWYSYSPSEMSLNGDNINKMPIPDRFIFQGRLGMDILKRSGYPEDRCALTGAIRFDSLMRVQKKDIPLEIPKDKKVLLVATTYSKEDSDAIIDMVMGASASDPNLYIVFKPHPNYPVDETLKKYGPGNYTISGLDIHQLILRSDALVTSYSTTADEAIALSCPVVSIDTGILVNMSTFFDIEAAPVVNNRIGLKIALHDILYDAEALNRYKEKWPELIEASFFRLDGRSKDRILGVLKDMI